MGARRLGIQLASFLPGGTQLPAAIQELLLLTVDDHRVTTNGRFFLHEGVLVSLGSSVGIDVQSFPVSIPLLTSGLRFRLALRKKKESPTPTEFVLDIWLDRFQVSLPGVIAAKRIEADLTSAKPTHLEPDPAYAAREPSQKAKPVQIVGGGVLRIEKNDGANAVVRLVDLPDPFDPDAPAGPIASIACEPPHMLIGASGFGLTLGKFTLDLSETTSPQEVLARNQGENWKGLYAKEAALYLPPDTPVVGPLSLTLRDALFGVPTGMQFEAQLEWGSVSNNDLRQRCGLELKQGTAPLDTSKRDVQLQAGAGPSYEVIAKFTKPSSSGDESPIFGVRVNDRIFEFGNDPVTTTLQVLDGSQLRVAALIGATATDKPSSALPEMVWTFRAPAGASANVQAALLKVQRKSGGTSVDTTSVRGPAVDLADLVFSLPGETDPPTWQLGADFQAQTATKATLELSALKLPLGTHLLEGKGKSFVGRVRIEVVEKGVLLVGTPTGVVSLPGSSTATPEKPPIRRALTTYALPAFLREGQLTPLGDTKANAPPLSVPANTLAEVEVDLEGLSSTQTPPAQPATPPTPVRRIARRASVGFAFGSETIKGWVWKDDSGTLTEASQLQGGTFDKQLQAWLNAEPVPKEIYVVTRTDDVAWNKDLSGNNAYNAKLAQDRATAVESRIRSLSSAQVFVRSEFVDPKKANFAPPAGVDVSFEAPDEPAWRLLVDRRGGWVDEGKTPVWAEGLKQAADNATYMATIPTDETRIAYRRADIWLVTDAPDDSATTAPSSTTTESSEASAKFLIPGALSTALASTTPTPVASEPTARKDSLVRLRGVWDSPVVNGFGDVLPTMIEVTTKWKPSKPVELPVKKPDGQDEQPVPIGLGTKAWQLQIRIAHDARADSTKVSLTVDIPDDEVTVKEAWVAVALALAPAVVARLDAKEGLVAMPLLLGAGYVFKQFGWVDQGRVMLHRVATDFTDRGGRSLRFACDYSVGLDNINVSLFGQVTVTGKGLVMRYTGVHVEIDWDKPEGNGLHLGYDQASVSVAKAGTWTLSGPAGDLLRVVGSRSGVGSTWIELDLAFALNLGVIKVEGATIRITMNGSDMSAELRGLTITVNVPKLLVGKGSLTVESGGAGATPGTIRGALDIKVIPAKLSAAGAVAINSTGETVFVSVEVGVKFATALPLASTGLGIFGFMGRFVANGTRNLPTGVDDPVDRELQWFQLAADKKYIPKQGQYALGLGVVVGTLPDGGTTFNAEGSLSLGFPDISLVLGIIAHFIVPPKDVSEEGDAAGSSKLVGLISVDEKALILGIRGAYNIPKVIDVQIPISGYFPFPQQGGRPPAYLRIGADGQEQRYGQPVTVTLFKDLFNVKAWAYLMIEERGLKRLGGRDSLNFDGFSIGMGAGFDLRWGAGPLSLEASASILLGLGTKPLAIGGLVEVRGRLRLLFLTIGLEGRIKFFLSEPTSWFEAEFCAEISLFFFSIRACISFASGKDEIAPPPPDPLPLLGVVLTDARGAIVAPAPEKLDNAPIVWPDIVPVVRFAAKFADGRKSGTFPTNQLEENPGTDSPYWVGPEALQYQYRVDRIDLVRIDGTDPEPLTNPLPSLWWAPSHRPSVVVDETTAEEAKEEAQQLGLLYWHPNPAWRSILTAEDLPEPLDGGPLAGLLYTAKPVVGPKDPLEGFIQQTYAAICGYSPEPKPAFARGEDVGFSLFGRVNLKPRAPSPAPFPSFFELLGGRVIGGDAQTTTAALVAMGATIDPPKVCALANAVIVPECSEPLTRGLMIDHVQFQGMDACTAAFALQSKPVLENPHLWLAMTSESEPLDKHPALTEGFPLGRLRIAHFGCAKLGRRERVTRGGAVIRPLKNSTLEVIDSRSWGRLGHIEHVRGTEIDPDMRVFGMNERFSCGVRVQFATRVRHVIVDLIVELLEVDAANVRIVSLRDDGEMLADQDVTLENGGRNRIAVTAQDMKGLVILFGRGADWFLRGIEMRVPPWIPTEAQINHVFDVPKHDPKTKWPIVEGRRSIFSPWEPWIVEPEPQGNVQLLHARPQSAGPWFDMRILPWARGRLAIVGVSAISNDAREKQREDQKKRDAIKDSLKDAPKSPEEAAAKRFFLEPKATYKLEVVWSWRARRREGSITAWAEKKAQYYFRTAEAKPLPEPPVIPGQPKPHFLSASVQGGIGYTQETFDPRGLQRYVLGIDPDPKAPPHFRHDPLSIHFAVDYTEQLAKRYDYDLVREVRRTRAKAGELNPTKNPSPMNTRLLNPIKGPLPPQLMHAADKWIRNAVDTSPCLGKGKKPALGGHTEQHFVDLVPGGEYDFVLCAQRKISGQLAEEVLIVRSRFHASRYESPAHLMTELGFDADGQGGRFYDAIVSNTPTLPASGLVDDAGALEQARGSLGISPSAASRLPRTTLLWKNNSLVGALLESDEPILRVGRVDGISLQASNGTVNMNTTKGWCDTTGSVILLWFDVAVAGPTSVGLTLQVSALDVNTESIVKKSIAREIFLGGKPMAALQEAF